LVRKEIDTIKKLKWGKKPATETTPEIQYANYIEVGHKQAKLHKVPV